MEFELRRMNLRKFHLLLAEWRLEQRIIGNRWYRLYTATGSWTEKPPEPWEAFQFLEPPPNGNGHGKVSELGDDFDPNEIVDDNVILQQVGAAITPQWPDEYQNA